MQPEVGDQVLQALKVLEVLEAAEAAEEVKPVIVTTTSTTAAVAEDANSSLLPGRSSGPSTQPSQVGQGGRVHPHLTLTSLWTVAEGGAGVNGDGVAALCLYCKILSAVVAVPKVFLH